MTFKFISLNIWKGGQLFDRILNFLEKEKADILALQEVSNSEDQSRPIQSRSFSVLKEKLGYRQAIFAKIFVENRGSHKIPWGNAVYTNFPVINSNRFFYDIPFGEVDLEKISDYTYIPRGLQQVDLQIGQANVSIFNNHGIWGKDGQDNPRRLKMGEIIATKIKFKLRTILAGDFNMDPRTRTIAKIEKNVNNIFKDGLKSTFNLKQKKEAKWGGFSVDMMFASPNIKVVEHDCPQVDISDHLPLKAVFEIV